MDKNKARVGTRVKSLRDFSGVPKGTQGIIDEDYGNGVMVAWDKEDRPLPSGWTDFESSKNQSPRHEWPLRDGFEKETELQFLEEI